MLVCLRSKHKKHLILFFHTNGWTCEIVRVTIRGDVNPYYKLRTSHNGPPHSKRIRLTKLQWRGKRRKQPVRENCFFIFSFFFFFVNVTITRAVNFDGWFESFEWFMSIISIFLNLWVWMSRHRNQTHFECYEFDVDVVLILIATCTYKSIV